MSATAAEYPDPELAVRRVVDQQRHRFKQTIQELLDEMDVPGSLPLADQLVMLREGAMVGGHLSGPRVVADALYAAGRAVLQFRSES